MNYWWGFSLYAKIKFRKAGEMMDKIKILATTDLHGYITPAVNI